MIVAFDGRVRVGSRDFPARRARRLLLGLLAGFLDAGRRIAAHADDHAGRPKLSRDDIHFEDLFAILEPILD